uniref:Homeobox domain-containing protein n=1 Tax=Trichuris muris TaxID=70415 RepID=A0A5S6R133_TRIMR
MTAPLYTVEQVELVRRLRQTGISLAAVAEIYGALDRLEDELHVEFPLSLSNFPQPFDYLVPRNGKEGEAFPLVFQPTDSRTNSSTSASSADSIVPTDQNGTMCPMTYMQSAIFDKLRTKNGSAPDMVANEGRAVAMDLSIRQERKQPCPVQLQTAEQQEELEQLKKKDEEEIIKEIREFVSRNQLRQQSIAYMTGISQPYVSKFLNGVAKELSERVRNLMFTWYVVFKNNPEIISEFPTNSYIKSRTMQSKERLQRRERFSFKQQHINILEQYFKEEPYPNVYMRKEIATACNHELQRYQDDVAYTLQRHESLGLTTLLQVKSIVVRNCFITVAVATLAFF